MNITKVSPELCVGMKVKSSGYEGTVYALPPGNTSVGHVPDNMVCVRLPGGLTVTTQGDCEPLEKLFKVRVACNIRAYGVVHVAAGSADEICKKVTANYVAENFEPHGGSGDLDWMNPSEIWLESAEDLHDESEEDLMLEHDIEDEGAA